MPELFEKSKGSAKKKFVSGTGTMFPTLFGEEILCLSLPYKSPP